MSFVYFLCISAKIILTNQSNYFTNVEADELIRIPKHCYVLGHPSAEDSANLNGKFVLFKPIRKMHEYEYNIERGIPLDKHTNDSVALPDFSTQAVSIGIWAVFLSLLYRIFG